MKHRFRYNPDTDEVEEVGPPRVSKPSGWSKPLHSESMGVSTDEVPQAKEFDKTLGLGDVEYDTDGCPVFYSKGEQERFYKAHGYHNRVSGKGHYAIDGAMLKRVMERFASA